jgi:hypothetical protein
MKYVAEYESAWGPVAQSVWRMNTGWSVLGSNPDVARFVAHVETGPGVHPASCTIRSRYFPGVKNPGRGADHPPVPSAEVMKE